MVEEGHPSRGKRIPVIRRDSLPEEMEEEDQGEPADQVHLEKRPLNASIVVVVVNDIMPLRM